MISRIQLIMKSRNISAAQFADEIGVQRSSVSHILTGRNNPSLDIILKILQRFPEVNSDWILTGNGAMLKSDIGKESSTLHAKSFISSTEKNNSDKNKELDLFAQSHLGQPKSLPRPPLQESTTRWRLTPAHRWPSLPTAANQNLRKTAQTQNKLRTK